MKLHFSQTSPFVRKVMICAHEKGIADQLELIEGGAVADTNPLAKVPALIADDGEAIFDSLVICDYLDALGSGPALIPADRTARNLVLRRHALADGVMEAAVASVTEARRPEDKRWDQALAKQHSKIELALVVLERQAANFGDSVDLGTISVGAALGYLDLRMPDLGWRESHPKLAAWYQAFATSASMQQTKPPG